MPRQTTLAKPHEVQASWYHVDADGQVLGRLATEVARLLQGKHKPEYTPHVDTGDFVVITNAEKITLTGRKREQKTRTDYSGFPGGLRRRSYGEVLDTRPELIIERAISRMLPKGILGRQMGKKLKIYRGGEHPHQAQQPQAFSIGN